MQKKLLAISAAVGLMGIASPALADSYSQLYNLVFPSGTTELWTDTTISNGGVTYSGGGIPTYYHLSGYDSSGNRMADVGVVDVLAGSTKIRQYIANMQIYDTSTGTNTYQYFPLVSNASVANNSSARYYMRAYSSGSSPTGYTIDSAIVIGSTTYSTNVYWGTQYLATNVGKYFGQGNVTDLYSGCNKNTGYSHPYSNAWYKNSSGTFVRWPASYGNTMSNASCPTTASYSGTIGSGSTGYLSVQ